MVNYQRPEPTCDDCGDTHFPSQCPARDYQRPPGTPEPEGGTISRSPYVGWLRNTQAANGWLNRVNWRTFKATAMVHILNRKKQGRTHGL